MSVSCASAAVPAPVSRAELAYQTLRRRIIDNVWPPGYRALEQELAAELGISRTPVREALLRLQNEGLAAVVPRHGMSVLPVSPDDMRDIYQMLAALEATAAELVAGRGPSAAELRPLEEAARAMQRALAADDLDAWAGHDESFHRHLVGLCGNRLLIDTVQNCWDRSHRARLLTLRMRPKPVLSTSEHLDVLQQIRAGNTAAAFELHRAHRARSSRELLAILHHYRITTL
jgi:DNA-binding GntR family transcriptional regulator